MKKKNLTLVKLAKLYSDTKNMDGCDECGRRIRYVYFLENKPIIGVCGYHQLKEAKQTKNRKGTTLDIYHGVEK